MSLEARGEGNEAKVAALARVEQALVGEHAAHALAHEVAAVQRQVERGDHVHPIQRVARPVAQRSRKRLARGDDALSCQVGGRDAFEPPHGAVAQRKRAPYVGHRQVHGVHLGVLAHLAFQHHVVEPAHQPVFQLRGGAAVDGEIDGGVGAPHLVHGLRDERHRLGFARSDVDGAADRSLGGQHVLLGLARQLHDGLRVAAQDGSLIGQLDALGAARVQLAPELLLERRQLARERRLGDVQGFRRVRDVALARDGQEVLQGPQFHDALLSLVQQSYTKPV